MHHPAKTKMASTGKKKGLRSSQYLFCAMHCTYILTLVLTLTPQGIIKRMFLMRVLKLRDEAIWPASHRSSWRTEIQIQVCLKPKLMLSMYLSLSLQQQGLYQSAVHFFTWTSWQGSQILEALFSSDKRGFFCFVSFTFLNTHCNFRIVLDLQKSCEDSTENSHVFYTQVPLLLTSYVSLEHLSQLTKQNSYIIIIIKMIILVLYSYFLSFYLIPFFSVLGSLQRYHITWNCYVCLGVSYL